MAVKTANITARIIPFALEIPSKLATRDSMSEAEFNELMSRGLEQAKEDESVSVEAAFSELRMELVK